MHAVLIDRLSRAVVTLKRGGAVWTMAALALAVLSGAIVDRLIVRCFVGNAGIAGEPAIGVGVRGSAVPPDRSVSTPISAGVGVDRESPIVGLERHWQAVAKISRPLLLGSRIVAEGSCVTRMERTQIESVGPTFSIDLDGGPGTTISILLEAGRSKVRSAAEDYHWHQSRLVTHLENQSALHATALEGAIGFLGRADALVERLDALRPADPSAWPDELVGDLPSPATDTWPGLCLARLSSAIERRDLPGARRWAHELSGAAWRLVDLHRWIVFLSENHLEALRFQRLCRNCFEAADGAGIPYVYQSTPSGLPAGMLTLHGRDNYLEVERQAEQVFSVSRDLLAALQTEAPPSAAGLLAPPLLRPTFLTYLEALGGSNRETLLRAARTPYESSFLFNSMFRAKQAGTVAEQCEVLRRLDRITPRAPLERLMGAFVYRGHFFAGFDWSDRYADPLHAEPLVPPSASDLDAFRAACREAHDAFQAREAYGPTLTLRQSLESGVIDCVRATDRVLNRYRNEGRSGVGHVRWLAGAVGHSLPVLFGSDEITATRPTLVDPLVAEPAPATWPDAYAAGAQWPEVLAGQPPVQAAEFYVRGIDSYVWAQGYCVGGPAAGRLVIANIPYVPILKRSPMAEGTDRSGR